MGIIADNKYWVLSNNGTHYFFIESKKTISKYLVISKEELEALRDLLNVPLE